MSVRSELHGHVRRLTLDRPERRNALDSATVAFLRAEVQAAALDLDVRLIQLGAEGTTWCAGADLAAIAAHPGGRHAVMLEYADLLADLAESPVPVMAVVDGAVIGGGVGLLCAADLVVMGPASRVSLPEAGVGLWPMMVGALLPRVMSPRQAMELALTGRRLSVEECEAYGLATRVHHDVEVAAEQLTALVLKQAPGAVRAGRRAWLKAGAAAGAPPLREQLRQLAESLDQLAEQPEATEGITAFFEKRTPVW